MNNNIGLFSILKLKTPLSFYFLAVKSRWQVPSEQPYFSASTANDLRRDKYPVSPDPEKLKALMRGYSQSDSLFSFIVFFYFYCWYLVVNSPFFCWALFFFSPLFKLGRHLLLLHSWSLEEWQPCLFTLLISLSCARWVS